MPYLPRAFAVFTIIDILFLLQRNGRSALGVASQTLTSSYSRYRRRRRFHNINQQYNAQHQRHYQSQMDQVAIGNRYHGRNRYNVHNYYLSDQIVYNNIRDYYNDPYRFDASKERYDVLGKKGEKRCHLKLYWREGYKWQGEKTERKWCLEKKYSRPLLQKCNSDQEQLWVLNDEDKTIRLADDTSQCMERRDKKIVVRPCHSRRRKQQFDFSGDSKKFEIRNEGLCMTNRHHPKAYEPMNLEPCQQARRSDTSLWEWS